jgi:hypothetical protein
MKKYLPALIWLAFLGTASAVFRHNYWEGVLVVFAALVLVPQGLALLDAALAQPWWYWFAAGGLCTGYLVYPEPAAVFGALPYLLVAAWLTVREIADMLVFKKTTLRHWVRAAALGYWAAGAAWAVFFLGGIRPLGFDSGIVGLTAAHFHVAGFVVAVVVYCLLAETSSATSRILGWGVLAGMPLVAAGITATKLGYSPVLECTSALAFVALALGTICKQTTLVFQKKYPPVVRAYWLIGAVCLLAGGVLATLYALRFRWPIQWVNIPNMKIWHGTLNTLGFGWMTLQGWRMLLLENEKSMQGHTSGRA